MPESLEDFLGTSSKDNLTLVNGSLSCQECEEIVNQGFLDENTMILTYKCSSGHKSGVKL